MAGQPVGRQVSAADLPLVVTDHAMWRAAERFPRFDTVAIEEEVRSALRAGRISTDRQLLGLARRSDPRSLYVWTEDGERIYSLRHDDQPPCFVVTTTMRRGMGAAGDAIIRHAMQGHRR
jgi:hypothetical protein